MKILIAEDDRATRKLITNAVEEMGHTAMACLNGQHAHNTLLANEGIAALVTDVMMPEMDGRQLIQIVRGNSSFGELPILVMSAVVGPRDIADLLTLGATRFIGKPFKIENFKADLTGMLTRETP
ncbi:MAG: response regulator [Planctomycetota bacterium]|jgi:DNA-binding response OmpR family regulator